MKRKITLPLFLAMMCTDVYASLIFNINTYNPNELSFLISGTIDNDVEGEQKNWLAVKSNWSSNVGLTVDWIADSIGQSFLELAPGVTIIENTVTFGGVSPVSSNIVASKQLFGDAIYWDAGFDILAGTEVTGNLTISGTNIFKLPVSNFQLVSGFDAGHWVRLEATAPATVPLPASIWLFATGLIALTGACKRRVRK